MTPPIDLGRPRSISELLDASFTLWWKNRAVLFTLSLIIVAPVAIVTTGILRNLGDVNRSDVTLNDVSPLFIVLVLALIQQPLLTGTIARAVQRMAAGETVAVGEALRDGLAVFTAALAAIVLSVVVIFAGFLLLIVPGIVLFVRLTFVAQAAAIEGTGPRAALQTSLRLSKGHFKYLLVIVLLVLFGGFIAGTLAQAPFAAVGGTPALAARAIIQSTVNSISAVVLTLVYFDLRARTGSLVVNAMEVDPAAESA